MSGDVSDRKRLLTINAANLEHNHIYFTGHHDFFPPKCYGGSSKNQRAERELTLVVDGLPDSVRTDIPTQAGNGKPRNFFRKRAWVRRFFEKHEIREGSPVRFVT